MTTSSAPSTTAAADARIPAQHPFAAHLRRAAAAERTARTGPGRRRTAPLPSLYLSHGAPMLFEMTDWMTQLHGWARALPKPKAILIVSAHWESAPLAISSTRPDRAGLRLRRLRPDVLPDALRHPRRRPTSPAQVVGAAAGRRARCTSTAAAASTTAPGCR